MRTRGLTTLALCALTLATFAPSANGTQDGTSSSHKDRPAARSGARKRPIGGPARPALAVRLVAREADGTDRPVDPTAPIARGAAVRLSIRPAEDAFLYVLLQEEGRSPVVLFPDDRSNDGQNFIAAGAECAVPAYCPDAGGDDDCWRRISREAGRAYLVVILTKDRRADLANEIVRRGPIAFNQADDALVDAGGKRVADVDARPVAAASGEDAPRFGLTVADANPADRQLVDVLPLTVVETAPPLALTWRLVRRDARGTVADVDPRETIATGDDLRLVCRPSRTGYLYVLRQAEGAKPVLLYPDARVNDGRNLVAGGEEYSVPSYCPDGESAAESCWRQLAGAPGRESLIMLLSTERIEDAVTRLLASAISLDPATGRLLDGTGETVLKIDPRAMRPGSDASSPTFEASVASADADARQVADVVALTVKDAPRPLAIGWRLVRRDKDGAAVTVDPTTKLLRNEELRLVVTATRGGYLSVLLQEEGSRPVVIFPDPHINDGQNYIAADKEYRIPAYCPEGRRTDGCWQQFTKRPGRKLLLVIFAAETPNELVDHILGGGPISLDEAASGQLVDTSTSTPLGLVNPRAAATAEDIGAYVVQAVSTDPDATEPIVDAILLDVDKRDR